MRVCLKRIAMVPIGKLVEIVKKNSKFIGNVLYYLTTLTCRRVLQWCDYKERTIITNTWLFFSSMYSWGLVPTFRFISHTT